MYQFRPAQVLATACMFSEASVWIRGLGGLAKAKTKLLIIVKRWQKTMSYVSHMKENSKHNP